MLLVDTVKKVFVRDEELKLEIARLRPVKKWLRSEVVHLEHILKDDQMKYGRLTNEYLCERELSLHLDPESVSR